MSAVNLVLEQRRSGVLLHPTSLPGSGTQGHLGAEAFRFVDFLADCGFSVWQTLPLNPRDDTGSPYCSPSVFAIDPGLRDPAESVASLDSADPAFAAFVNREQGWLEDYALFTALRHEYDRPWYEWPESLRDREPQALAAARERHGEALARIRAEQFLCDRQWRQLKRRANERGILLFGDLSFFVAYDSADVWSRRDLFQLDAQARMAANTGVPPDYFSATGQLWGMPQYEWQRMAETGWHWWIERMRRQLALFDVLRLDHFRGLAATWHVPPRAETAAEGHWAPGPGAALLDAMTDALGALPLVAEDLGEITEDVNDLRRKSGLPGMRVLQFAYGADSDNPHLPHNYAPDTVVYTGTHDNNTLAGWWHEDCDTAARDHVLAYLGGPSEAACDAITRQAMASVARLAVLPMQDLLGLDAQARMNTPGTSSGNWAWRLTRIPEAHRLANDYRALNVLYGRCAEA